MASSTRLEFDVLANDRASSKLDKIARSTRQLGSGLVSVGRAGATGFGKLGHLIGGAAKMGVAGIAVLGAGLLAAAPAVMDMAGNLELMGKKAQVVFGSELGNVQAWADANAHAMGVTKREAVGLASSFADLLIPMGFTRKQAAGMATDTIGLSGALAEWSGGQLKAAEVAEILSAAYLGERDGLQALGISISQAEVDAALLAKGQQDLTGKARQQAEALATQALIMAKSTDAQAAFAKGGDSLARKMASSRARLREMAQTLLVTATPALTKLAAAIGTHVLPQAERFVAWLSGPGKHVIAEWALGGTQAVLGFADMFLGALDTLLGGIQNWGKWILRSMAATMAPFNMNLARSMWKAAGDIDSFAAGARTSMGKARGQIQQWNEKLATMRTEARLKANISDLQSKLATAQAELRNPNLTKERRAKLNADIAALKTKIAEAQGKINALKGKTVVIRYSATGVNLTTPSSVGRRQHGGPVTAGMPYIVGERQPELFVPATNGTILPSVPGGMGDGTIATFTIPVVIDGRTVQQSLLKLKRTNGGLALGLS